MRAFRSILVLAGLALAAACASKGATASTAPKRDRNLITEQEILDAKTQDAYATVRALRPGWLLPKMHGSGRAFVQVYVEGNKAGNVDVLSQYSVNSIRELRYIDGEDATTRFGTGNGAGAILVFLKR
jgi:hypothetical protein